MRPVNPMSIIPKYAKDSTYVDGPTPAQQEAGMIPLDTVPADWWNKLFQQLSEQVNNACNGMTTAYNEILNVLSAANIQPDATQNDQLASAINNLRQTVANAINAGAVKSSTTSGKVSVDANGIMTPNGLGTPTTLNTTSKEVVGAINELKSTYDQSIQTLSGDITSLGNDKAPNNHASSATTYGVGDATNYGHLKLSDATTDNTLDATKGVAATPAAVKAVRDIAVSAFALPVGTILPFAGATVPAGYFLCDGTSYLRTAYPELFAALGTLYNLPTDGDAVFRVPDLRNRTIMGANPDVAGKADGNVSDVGDIQKAQLPNIKGYLYLTGWSNSGFSNILGHGPFSGRSDYSGRKFIKEQDSTGDNWRGILFDTSASGSDGNHPSSIDHLGDNVYYGDFNNATEANRTFGEVRSANIRMNWIIKY